MKKPSKSIEFALRQLLVEATVSTHEEICETLKKQGFHINQPKVSRLLHQLGAIKVTDPSGETHYRLPHDHGLMHEIARPQARLSLKSCVIDIVSNGLLIVMHTTPGAAHLVAREIDLRRSQLHLLGTLAGDDTIFIAPKNAKQIQQIIKQIEEIVAG
jgi:transcriptional regulator of arginine metabolism